MADKRITELATLATTDLAATDLVVVVDVSDTTMAPSGTDKQMAASGFVPATSFFDFTLGVNGTPDQTPVTICGPIASRREFTIQGIPFVTPPGTVTDLVITPEVDVTFSYVGLLVTNMDGTEVLSIGSAAPIALTANVAHVFTAAELSAVNVQTGTDLSLDPSIAAILTAAGGVYVAMGAAIIA